MLIINFIPKPKKLNIMDLYKECEPTMSWQTNPLNLSPNTGNLNQVASPTHEQSPLGNYHRTIETKYAPSGLYPV